MSQRRRFWSLATTLALALTWTAAVPGHVLAVVGFCNTAYVTLYDGDTRSTPNRTYCYGISDQDIEGEPGNVMGPLHDGNPVVYMDDFDASETSSGVNSIYLYNGAGGQRTFCFYSGKAYSGILDALEVSGSGGVYFTGIGAMEGTLGSLKIVNGGSANCP